MSWLSNATGIHIGLGPKQVTFAPPPEIAANPAALAAWQHTQDQVNGAVGRAGTINKGALAAVGALAGAGALGYGPMAFGGAGTAGAAGSAAGVGSAASAPLSLGSLVGGLTKGAGAIGAVGGFLGDHPGLVDTGLGTASAINAANLGKQSTQYAKNAMDTANQSYDSRAPLRLAGVQGMLNPKPSSDLSALHQVAARGNPFAARAPLPLSQVR